MSSESKLFRTRSPKGLKKNWEDELIVYREHRIKTVIDRINKELSRIYSENQKNPIEYSFFPVLYADYMMRMDELGVVLDVFKDNGWNVFSGDDGKITIKE